MLYKLVPRVLPAFFILFIGGVALLERILPGRPLDEEKKTHWTRKKKQNEGNPLSFFPPATPTRNSRKEHRSEQSKDGWPSPIKLQPKVYRQLGVSSLAVCALTRCTERADGSGNKKKRGDLVICMEDGGCGEEHANALRIVKDIYIVDCLLPLLHHTIFKCLTANSSSSSPFFFPTIPEICDELCPR